MRTEPDTAAQDPSSSSAARFLDSILEHMPAIVFVKRASDLRFERFNRAGEELLGVERDALIGKNDFDIFPPEQAAFFTAKDREVLERGTLVDIPQEPIQTPKGVRWLHTLKIPVADENGVPSHLLGVSMDITEQRQAAELLLLSHDQLQRNIAERTVELEKQMRELERAEDALAHAQAELRHSQKMEAIGRLAGGVAHDFNNLLTVIGGYSELVLAQLPEHDGSRSYVEQIHRAAGRASDLTHQLLAFGRRQVLKPKVIDLGEIVRDMEDMLSRLLGEDMALTVLGGRGLPPVTADPNQVEQVIMNLVVNARDAMPHGGRLTIETLAVSAEESPLCDPDNQPCAAVCLRVSDTGIGMDAATLEQIFEPFFTTKPVGKGSGLGLSTAFGITKQSGGTIAVQSELARGTVFSIFLPAQVGASVAPDSEPPSVELRGSELVLLVEDEPRVREFAAVCLRSLGYRVIEAAGPHEALDLASKHDFDLLLTDVVMPDGGGRLLAEELVRRAPRLKVLFMSGYADDAVALRGVLTAGAVFLQKPLTKQRLATQLRRALAQERPLREPPVATL
jgi:two-component system cell cycle sensor histidine kinase/response regulator CckA